MKHIFLFVAVIILFNCKPEKEEPKPLTAPVLTTMEAGDITAVSALSGGAISSDGGSPVTARGIVWGVSHNPTLADSVSEEGTGIGSFTSDLTPLKYSTTYYVRAYATNSIGTTYGNEVTFNTKAAVPSDGLVGWWPFNGNANDESGNGNDGEVYLAQLTKDRYANSESAYLFDNGPDKITVANSGSLQLTNSFTVSCWIKTLPNTYGTGNEYYNILSKWGGGGDASYLLGINPAGNLFFNTHNFSDTQNNFISTGLVGNSVLNFDSWYHLSYTQNNSQGKLYINGTLIGEKSDMLVPMVMNNYVLFGSNEVPLGYYPSSLAFEGTIDDIAIYNRALTAEEIQKIYNGTGF